VAGNGYKGRKAEKTEKSGEKQGQMVMKKHKQEQTVRGRRKAKKPLCLKQARGTVSPRCLSPE
jgi:hypothetical protein